MFHRTTNGLTPAKLLFFPNYRAAARRQYGRGPVRVLFLFLKLFRAQHVAPPPGNLPPPGDDLTKFTSCDTKKWLIRKLKAPVIISLLWPI